MPHPWCLKTLTPTQAPARPLTPSPHPTPPQAGPAPPATRRKTTPRRSTRWAGCHAARGRAPPGGWTLSSRGWTPGRQWTKPSHGPRPWRLASAPRVRGRGGCSRREGCGCGRARAVMVARATGGPGLPSLGVPLLHPSCFPSEGPDAVSLHPCSPYPWATEAAAGSTQSPELRPTPGARRPALAASGRAGD